MLGVPEINGVAQPPAPFPNGERIATRTVSIVLSGVEPRLRIATKVLSATQGDIVIVRVQRSRMPAMVHLDGRTEFWIRRDRQRIRMSQQEIVAMVTIGLQEAFNRQRFLQDRFDKVMRGSGSAIGIFLAATPDSLSDDIVSIHDRNIQGVMQESTCVRDSAAWCRAQLRTPEERREQALKAAKARWERHEKVDVVQSPQPQPEPAVRPAESPVEAEARGWADEIPLDPDWPFERQPFPW